MMRTDVDDAGTLEAGAGQDGEDVLVVQDHARYTRSRHRPNPHRRLHRLQARPIPALAARVCCRG